MFGGGHIQAMIQSIKFNARDKKNRYDKNKNYDTSNIPLYQRPITSKKLTQKEKDKVRNRLKKQRFKDKLMVSFKIGIFMSLIFLFWYLTTLD